MSRNMPGNTGRNIQEGWDVIGADNERIGEVHEVHGHYFIIEKGLLFKSALFIPFSAVSGVGDNTVQLNVRSDEVESMGWDEGPPAATSDRAATGTTGTTEADRSATRGRTGRMEETTDETMHIPVAEEELEARKHEEEKGRVHVHKDVVEERETMNVPVREEEVHVERTRADHSPTDVPSDAFQEEDIEIPVRGEEVDVEKKAKVREHVDVSKSARQRQERVSDTVRREDVHVEGEGRVEEESNRDVPPA